MKMTFLPRGVIMMEDAELYFRNFAGRRTDFNDEGKRNFHIRIREQEIVDQLLEEGFNVKIKDSRDGSEEPFMTLKVNVKYHPPGHEFERLNPVAVLMSGRNRIELDEESIADLDDVYIIKADLYLTGSNWTNRMGGSGRSAYLKKIYVTQDVDILDARYAEEEWPDEY